MVRYAEFYFYGLLACSVILVSTMVSTALSEVRCMLFERKEKKELAFFLPKCCSYFLTMRERERERCDRKSDVCSRSWSVLNRSNFGFVCEFVAYIKRGEQIEVSLGRERAPACYWTFIGDLTFGRDPSCLRLDPLLCKRREYTGFSIVYSCTLSIRVLSSENPESQVCIQHVDPGKLSVIVMLWF